jgi:hypothetical protein
VTFVVLKVKGDGRKKRNYAFKNWTNPNKQKFKTKTHALSPQKLKYKRRSNRIFCFI